MKNGVRSSWSRRRFIQGSFVLAFAAQFAAACKKRVHRIFLRLTGTNHVLAHRLRFPDFPAPTDGINTDVLIIGGGVTGLAAAYRLQQKGIENFMLLDLETTVGGNARSGENAYSKYPLGAHYLPLPNLSNSELLSFLEEAKIIVGWDERNQPIYDPEQLSFAPQARLFFRNIWQEGLTPRYGLTESDMQEFERFKLQMEAFKQQKDSDGRYVFDIPMRDASPSLDRRELDQQTFFDWMRTQGYHCRFLFDYVNYCCRDDYGLGGDAVSAFAGIHYFAARKHDQDLPDDVVLTWPEGNARLVSHLAKATAGKVLAGHLAYGVSIGETQVRVSVYDAESKISKTITAARVICCTPQFVNQYLFAERKVHTKVFHYAPWIVASIVLRKFPSADGVPLSWDNVIHGAKGLGYVYAQHQGLAQFSSPFVISYYYSLDGADVRKSRQQLYSWTDEQWKDFILDDLAIAHYGIESEVDSMEIFRHGHGMVVPVPGFLTSEARRVLSEPIADKVYFAHSDLSGISIFEEAFYQGIDVVDEMSVDKRV